ncbi:MAG: 50S ribosomal protein L18 [Candidatus Sungbacteria bacterium]|nr:50S ribosomal protein L18 [Candidatus Sungbacteria bacterium]
MGLKQEKRDRRHKRVRSRIRGTSTRPRLSVFRSNRHIAAQLIDDEAGRTLLSVSDMDIGTGKKKNSQSGSLYVRAEKVGTLLAEKAQKLSMASVVFDRGGYAYHGAVKALADGARKGGLQF